MWNSISAWWATVPSWGKPVLLAFFLGLGLTIVRALPWVVRQVKALWKWNQDRHNGKVLALMSEATRQARLEHPGMNIALLPFKITDIASELNRSQKSVHKSLRRLEAVGKVHEVRKGEWCLGNRTQKEILDDQWNEGRFGGNRFNRS